MPQKTLLWRVLTINKYLQLSNFSKPTSFIFIRTLTARCHHHFLAAATASGRKGSATNIQSYFLDSVAWLLAFLGCLKQITEGVLTGLYFLNACMNFTPKIVNQLALCKATKALSSSRAKTSGEKCLTVSRFLSPDFYQFGEASWFFALCTYTSGLMSHVWLFIIVLFERFRGSRTSWAHSCTRSLAHRVPF